MKNKYSKLVYFDEQAAVDFLESFNDGEITEKITNKIEKFGEIDAEAKAGTNFLNLFKVGLSGNFGRSKNSLVETQISRTVFTEFMSKSNESNESNESVLKNFENIELTIAKDSLTYYRNIAPYIKLFTNLDSIDKNKDLSGINHLEMDKILDNAKGYYEFKGIDKKDETNKVYIIRFNINGMRNNYSLYDLVKMNLSIKGIKVGETEDVNLNFEHEINTMIQKDSMSTHDRGLDFNTEQINETSDLPTHKADIIDVIIAGV